MQHARRPAAFVLALALVGLLGTTPVVAADLTPRLRLGGFGTVGAVYHQEDDFELRRSVNQHRGAKGDQLNLKIDTLLGAQANYTISPSFETVAQLLSHYDGEHGWRPQINRAFLRYRLAPSTQLRGGRLGLEILPRVDSRHVGYSFYQVRQPIEFGGGLARDNFDGVDLDYTTAVGEGTLRAKIAGGETGGTSYFSSTAVDTSDSRVWFAYVEGELQDWSLRFFTGAVLLNVGNRLNPLAQALRATGDPAAIALASDFDDDNQRARFHGFGLTYERQLIGRLNLARVGTGGTADGELYNGSAFLGRPMNAFTPFVSYAFHHALSDSPDTRLPEAPAFAPLRTALQEIHRPSRQRTYSIGVRWDFAPRRDLKLQVDYVETNSIYVIDRRPRREQRGLADAWVLNLAFDFLF